MSKPNCIKNNKSTSIIAITGGKGGVGKTTVAVNVSTALAMMDYKVFLFDADFGLSNVDILLGLHPVRNLSHVIENECELKDIILQGPNGLSIIPGASGIQKLVQLNALDYSGIVSSITTVMNNADYLIIDTAAGISDQVIHFCLASHEVVVVVQDEPTSLTDAYALIKILNKNYGINRFRILVNMSSSLYEAKKLFAKLTNVTDKFLNVVLHFLGWIPEDELLRAALKEQRPVVAAYPGSQASVYIKQIAAQIDTLPKKQFEFEQMIHPQLNVH